MTLWNKSMITICSNFAWYWESVTF